MAFCSFSDGFQGILYLSQKRNICYNEEKPSYTHLSMSQQSPARFIRFAFVFALIVAVAGGRSLSQTAQLGRIPQPEDTTGNLLVNGDFEEGLYYEDFPLLAGKAWQETHAGTGAGYTGTLFSSPYLTGSLYHSVPPNATVTFRGWFRATWQALFDIGFEAYDQNRQPLGYIFCGGAPTRFDLRVYDVWGKSECAVGWNNPAATRLPPGTAFVRPVVYFNWSRPGSTDNRLFLDDLYVGISNGQEGTPIPDVGNLLQNGSFESGTVDGFVGLSRTVRDSHTGWYAALRRQSSTDDVYGTTFIPVDTSKQYRLEGWFAGGSANTVFRFGLIAYDAQRQPLVETFYQPAACATLYRTVSVPSLWSKFTCTLKGEGQNIGQFPTGTRYVKPVIDSTGGNVRIDDLRLIQEDSGGSSSSSSVSSSVSVASSSVSVVSSSSNSSADTYGPNLLRNGDFETGTADNFTNLSGVDIERYAGNYGAYLQSAVNVPNSMTSVELMPVPQGAELLVEWAARRGDTPSAQAVIGVLAYDANQQPIGRPSGYGFGCGTSLQPLLSFWQKRTCTLKGEGTATRMLLPGTRYVRFVVWGYGSIRMDDLRVATKGGTPLPSSSSSSAVSSAVSSASSSVSSAPAPTPVLTITNTVGTTSVSRGSQFTHSITVSNTVPGSVVGSALVIASVSAGFQTQLPAGATFAAQNGGTCTVDQQRRSVTCNLLNITSASPRLIAFSVIAPQSCTVTNVGTAVLLSTGNPTFPSQSVNAESVSVTGCSASSVSSAVPSSSSSSSSAAPSPVLTLERSVTPTTVERGGTLTYSYTLTNTVVGSTALSAQVYERLAPGFTFQASTDPACTVNAADPSAVICRAGDLMQGSSRVFTVRVTAPQSCVGPFVSTAQANAANAALVMLDSPGITVTCDGTEETAMQLVSNGDIEMGSTQEFGGLTGVVSTAPHAGSYAAYRTGHGTVTHAQLLSVPSRGSLRFEVWARSAGTLPSLMNIGVQPFDEKRQQIVGGSARRCFSAAVQVPNVWTKYNCTIESDATLSGMRYARLQFDLNYSQGNTFMTQLDDIRFASVAASTTSVNLLPNGDFASRTTAGFTNLGSVSDDPAGDPVGVKHGRSGTTYGADFIAVPESAPVSFGGWFRKAQKFFNMYLTIGLEAYDANRQLIDTRYCYQNTTLSTLWRSVGCSWQFRGSDPTQLPTGTAFVRPFITMDNNLGSPDDRLHIDALQLVVPGGEVAVPQPNLTLTKDVSSTTVQRDGSVNYTVRLENTVEGSTVANANLSDTAPQGFSFQVPSGGIYAVPNGGNCTVTATSLSCSLNGITSATPRVITLTMVAPSTCGGPFTSTATAQGTPSFSLQAQTPGITVTGCSVSSASSAASSVPFIPCAAGWSCTKSITNNQCVDTTIDCAVGYHREVTGFCGTNTCVGACARCVPNVASSSAGPIPSLGMSKNVSAVVVQRGQTLTYTTVLRNNVAGTTIGAVTLTDALPQGFVTQLPAGSTLNVTNGGVCSVNGARTGFTCTYAGITSAAERTVSFMIIAPQTCGGPFAGTANATSDIPATHTITSAGITVAGCDGSSASSSSAVSSAMSSVSTGPVNLLSNGDFESGLLTGFQRFDAITTQNPHGGTYAARRAGGQTGIVKSYYSTSLSLSRGYPVTVEFWARSSGSAGLSRLTSGLFLGDVSNTPYEPVYCNTQRDVMVPSTWTKYVCVYEPQPTTNTPILPTVDRVNPFWEFHNNQTGAGYSIDIDDVRVYQELPEGLGDGWLTKAAADWTIDSFTASPWQAWYERAGKTVTFTGRIRATDSSVSYDGSTIAVRFTFPANVIPQPSTSVTMRLQDGGTVIPSCIWQGSAGQQRVLQCTMGSYWVQFQPEITATIVLKTSAQMACGSGKMSSNVAVVAYDYPGHGTTFGLLKERAFTASVSCIASNDATSSVLQRFTAFLLGWIQ